MICPNCGKQLQDGALFCTKCGSKMNPDLDVEARSVDNTINDKDSLSQVQDSGEGKAIVTNNTTGIANKEKFVWKEIYTYIAIASAVVIAAVVGLVFRFAKSGDDDNHNKNQINSNTVAEENGDYSNSEANLNTDSSEDSYVNKDVKTDHSENSEERVSNEGQIEDESTTDDEFFEQTLSEPQLFSVQVSADDGYVNMRTGPDTEYAIINPISNGITLPVFEKSSNGRWYRTEYENKSGWIAASQVISQNDDEMLDLFDIDRMTVEDYSANLDPDRYLFYDSGIAEFYFYYPAYLFNDVTVDDSSFSTEYGENIKSICFTGSAGSELYYSIYSRTDGTSISRLTDIINQNEHAKYFDMSDILVKSDDEKGRIVLAGVMDADSRYRIYDLIKIDDNYVYRMLSVKPKYRTEEERIQYAYVTENEYRMCGFSGSSQAARSYEEFLESNP